MKFCPNCGTQLEDSAVFCSNCGTNVGEPAPTQDTVQDYNNSAVIKKNKNIGIIAVAAAGALALILILSLIFGGSGYEEAIDNLIDVTFKGEFSKIEDLAPEKLWDEVDKPIDDLISELEEEYEEDMYNEFVEEFGADFSIDYEIDDESELSSTKVKKIGEFLNDEYDIEESSVKAAYKLNLKITISGDSEITREVEIHVIKIGSDWYPIEFDYDDGEVEVEFLVEDIF